MWGPTQADHVITAKEAKNWPPTDQLVRTEGRLEGSTGHRSPEVAVQLMDVRASAPLPFTAHQSLWTAVRLAWSSPGRHYHTLDHLHDFFERWTEVAEGPGWDDPDAAFMAMLTHDAVYEPWRRDNEIRSAALTRRWAEVWMPGIDVRRAEALVLATADHHGGPPRGLDRDLDHFLDCDLSILGAEVERYDRYARGVEAEYRGVAGDEVYLSGRTAFLERTLAVPVIFRSAWGRERWEAQARANMTRELEALRARA